MGINSEFYFQYVLYLYDGKHFFGVFFKVAWKNKSLFSLKRKGKKCVNIKSNIMLYDFWKGENYFS